MAQARPIRVLIADDQRPFAAMLETTLADHEDVEVVGRAANGQQAVDLAAELEPDVVLMDITMPVLDGLEATRRIRALPGERAAIPIVAITANAMKGDDQLCLDAGMDDYVSKPIDRARLLSKVTRWGYARLA